MYPLKPYIDRFPLLKAQGAYDKRQVPIRADWSDGDPDYEARFYILMHTKCAAVLLSRCFKTTKPMLTFCSQRRDTQP